MTRRLMRYCHGCLYVVLRNLCESSGNVYGTGAYDVWPYRFQITI